MRSTLAFVLAVGLGSLAPGCTDPDQQPGIEGDTHVATFDVRIDSPGAIDVVFVIDDGTPLAPFRDRLVESYPRMIEKFGPAPMLPDLRLMVVATSGGPRTSELVDGTFIEDVVHEDYTHVVNYRGTLTDAFASLADVEVATNANAQPLLALDRAIDPTNAFLRPEAMLYVVIVAARDDASADAPADYASRLKGMKADPNRVMVGILHAGDTPRLDELAAQFPNRNVVASLSDDDPADVMDLANLRISTLEGRCMPTPADVDPETPGVQADCSATATHFGSLEGVALPTCDLAAPPCWQWRPDPQCTAPYQHVEVLFGDALQPRNGRLVGQCVVAE